MRNPVALSGVLYATSCGAMVLKARRAPVAASDYPASPYSVLAVSVRVRALMALVSDSASLSASCRSCVLLGHVQ